VRFKARRGSEQYQATNSRTGVFVGPLATAGRQTIQYRRRRVLEIRECKDALRRLLSGFRAQEAGVGSPVRDSPNGREP
jgi:hypothetical protein